MTKVVNLNGAREVFGRISRRVYLRGLEAKGEGLSRRLASVTAKLEHAAWDLDSALSALRKDQAGYRTANAANPDGGANYLDGELEAAIAEAQRVLAILDASARFWTSATAAVAEAG